MSQNSESSQSEKYESSTTLGATPTQVRSRLVKKEERVRVNGARVSDTK